jgi:polyribonucleotide nucleotidyltransferase
MKKKILNSAVIDAVELSTAQNEYIDNAIGYQLEVISMDNVYNESRGNLVKLLVENVALALTDSPSYTSWNYIHGLIKAGICDATGMDEVSFDKNIWAHITSCLEKSYELTKPKSPNVKSEQKSEQRAKIDAMTDADLLAQGKLVELAKRQEKREKNAEKLENQSKKDFTKEFKTSMENLSKNEYAFALWIDSNINSLREQFLDSQS